MWVAVGVIGAAVIGGITTSMSAKASSKAATKAAAATAAANTKAAALNAAAITSAAAANAAATKYAAGQATKAAMYAARKAAEADKYAADKAEKAAAEALALQESVWQKQEEDMSPWLEAGKTGLNQLAYGMGLPGYEGDSALGESGYLQKDFEMTDFEEDPGYQFRLSEGLKALDRSASSKGNLLSGSALKGIERFGQDLASQEYQNAYNRYTGEQAWKYGQLTDISNTGLNAGANLGAAGSNYANSSGSILTGTAQQLGQNNIATANSLGNIATSTANTIGQGAINSANYIGQLGVSGANTQGQYGINTANAQANAAIAQANANASAYQGWGNALSTGINQLGQYYGSQYNSSPYYGATTNYGGTNASQWGGGR